MYLEKDKLSPLYNIAKEKSEQQDSKVIFSFTQLINLNTDILSLINIKLAKTKEKLYWDQPSKENQFLSFGNIISFNTNHLDKPSINFNIEKIIKDAVHTNETNQKDIPFFIGGQNFDINKKNVDIWKEYKSANYQIPEILILNNNNLTTITFYHMIDENKSFNSMYSKFSDYYNIIRNYIDDIKRSKPILESKEITVNKNTFSNQIAEVKDLIEQGQVSKVVLSNTYRYRIKQKGSDYYLLESLKKKYPECTIFYFDYLNKGKFLGASPELVLKNINNQIEIDALAGSIDNGKTPLEQAENQKKLYQDKKIKNEHNIVIKGIKEALLNINIEITYGEKHILKLKNIQHLRTPITAIKNDTRIMDILDVLSPTPALSGYPKNESMKIINQIEEFDRGWYSGTIGYISNNLNAEFYAGLRSAYINGEYIYIYAGAGITLDSNHDAEWIEIENKMNAIDQIINE